MYGYLGAAHAKDAYFGCKTKGCGISGAYSGYLLSFHWYPIISATCIDILETISLLLVEGGKKALKRARNTLDIHTDEWFFYPSLRNYHGPNSIIDVLRFRDIVEQAISSGKRVRVISEQDNLKRVNAVFLIGTYFMISLGWTLARTLKALREVSELMPLYQTEGEELDPDTISCEDCLRGLNEFTQKGLFNATHYDPDDVEFWEDPNNGDMNWIVNGMFLAFAGPDDASLGNFIDFARVNKIAAVVRLNEPDYDESVLVQEGISHLSLTFEDGTTPTADQIRRFIAFVDPIIKSNRAVAVHCRAGLGRTGTMIGCYLMRTFGLDCKGTIGWMRVMRPGCFLAQQPRFMEAIQWWLGRQLQPALPCQRGSLQNIRI